MRKRRGISLLEVMFSMGIIAVGLLGVTAILPLALNQVGRGRVLDNASRVGQNAVNEVRVRGMLAPPTWRAGQTVGGLKTSTSVTLALASNQGFCIDPLFVSVNTNDSDTTYDASWFPYFVRANTNDPRMTRISLAAINPSGMMRWAGAERIFVLQDELVFDIPEEKDTPPIQNFGSSRANRMYNGSTSWLATLSPNLEVTNQLHDAYVLSIVVFDNRNVTMPMDSETERLISVNWLTSSGLGGGDLVLESATLNDLVGIQSGKWIMLMGNVPTRVKLMPRFRWYRVVMADSEPVSIVSPGPPPTTLYRLNATVQGPDWNTSMATTGVFMPGVVAVYERSVRLESSSLWTN